MPQQIQELIDKIKVEGIQAADVAAKEIELQSQENARKIIEDAERKAGKSVADAKEEILKMQEAARMALKQSSRDVILSLRKEIEGVLRKLVEVQVKDSLTPEKIFHILNMVIEKFLEENTSEVGVQVVLGDEDLEDLKSGFLARLQEKLKQPVKFQSAEGIGKGFTISFDEGKSSFDFTDKSLAEYLSTYLTPQIAILVNEAIAEAG